MEEIIVKGTSSSPEIEFYNNGELKMSGKSMPEDVNTIFNPLIDFVKSLSISRVTFNFNLEYFNTATSKKLIDLLQHLDKNNKVDDIQINWHYEEGDEDSLETAEIYQELLQRSKFEYHEYAETVN
ncbi:MAG: DUF1987 domain-containing protein [Bacteroidales bacterium]|nr:DUF1987 domain-containing protein [Bacteroidales bacterium]